MFHRRAVEKAVPERGRLFLWELWVESWRGGRRVFARRAKSDVGGDFPRQRRQEDGVLDG